MNITNTATLDFAQGGPKEASASVNVPSSSPGPEPGPEPSDNNKNDNDDDDDDDDDPSPPAAPQPPPQPAPTLPVLFLPETGISEVEAGTSSLGGFLLLPLLWVGTMAFYFWQRNKKS
jgi:hypothetical protein